MKLPKYFGKIKKRVLAKHGSPQQRGRADAWYGRPPHPHCVYRNEHRYDLTEDMVKAYMYGYDNGIKGGKVY